MGPPDVLAFHLGDAAGGAHRVTWDGRELRYERFREGFEKLREARTTPDTRAWAAFARAIARVDPWIWVPTGGGDDDGERWSLELIWDGREARASGVGVYPEGFGRFKIALWTLLGNPPAL